MSGIAPALFQKSFIFNVPGGWIPPAFYICVCKWQQKASEARRISRINRLLQLAGYSSFEKEETVLQAADA